MQPNNFAKNVLFVTTTLEQKQDAQDLAKQVVEHKLAACASILPPILSVFSWQGSLQQQNEILILMKTTVERWPALKNFLEEKHPYDTPEIVAQKAFDVNEKYAQWLSAMVECN